MPKGRGRYIVAYDIRDPKRLRRVHKKMTEYGWPMQYSVFLSDLDGMEFLELRQELGEIINHGEDSVAMIDLGDPLERGKECFTFMGISLPLPTSGPVVI